MGTNHWMISVALPLMALPFGKGASADTEVLRAMAYQSVVMVFCEDLSVHEIGAGVIVASDNQEMRIVTAGHVVKMMDEQGCAPTERKICFLEDFDQVSHDCGPPASIRMPIKKAEVIGPFDLAILTVDASAFAGQPPRLDLLPSEALTSGAMWVTTIGFPNGRAWDSFADKKMKSSGKKSSSRKGPMREIEANVNEAYSGGGVFNAEWFLVGIVIGTTSGKTQILTIETILEELSKKGMTQALGKREPARIDKFEIKQISEDTCDPIKALPDTPFLDEEPMTCPEEAKPDRCGRYMLGSEILLSWNARAAKNCFLSTYPDDPLPAQDGAKSMKILKSTTFVLECRADGATPDKRTFVADVFIPPQIVKAELVPSEVADEFTGELRWDSASLDHCEIVYPSHAVEGLPPRGIRSTRFKMAAQIQGSELRCWNERRICSKKIELKQTKEVKFSNSLVVEKNNTPPKYCNFTLAYHSFPEIQAGVDILAKWNVESEDRCWITRTSGGVVKTSSIVPGQRSLTWQAETDGLGMLKISCANSISERSLEYAYAAHGHPSPNIGRIPELAYEGEVVTINWSSSASASCGINDGTELGRVSVSRESSREVAARDGAKYVLTCRNNILICDAETVIRTSRPDFRKSDTGGELTWFLGAETDCAVKGPEEFTIPPHEKRSRRSVKSKGKYTLRCRTGFHADAMIP